MFSLQLHMTLAYVTLVNVRGRGPDYRSNQVTDSTDFASAGPPCAESLVPSRRALRTPNRKRSAPRLRQGKSRSLSPGRPLSLFRVCAQKLLTRLSPRRNVLLPRRSEF